MSGLTLLRVQLPNKENTVVQVQEELVMQEILRIICEKRQFDPRDYHLTFENAKKKEEEIDLTMQLRQYDNLKEVTLQKVKKKSFLLPASSKDTNLRSLSPSASNLDQVQDNDSAQSVVVDGAFARKGRARSISATMTPLSRSASLQHGGPPPLRDLFVGGSSMGRMSSSGSQDFPTDPSEGSQLSLQVPSIVEEAPESSFSSAEEVAREKIILENVGTNRTMTLQRKKLRPRGNTVSAQDAVRPKEEEVVVRIILPNTNQTAIRVFPSTTIESILHIICEKRGLKFEDHTLQLQDSMESLDLDRPLSFFKLEEPVFRVAVSKEKSYSTMCVSEGGRDVMILTYLNGKLEVMAATEDKLIERVTDEQETDKKFTRILLLTFRSFMTPRDFFESLVSRFNSEPPENATEDELRYYNKWIDPVRVKVLGALQEWITFHWHDFEHDIDLRKSLEDFVDKVSKITGKGVDFETHCAEIKEQITRQLMRQRRITLVRMQTMMPAIPHTGDSPLINFKPKQVAEGLCLLDWELFSAIDGIEFLNQIWQLEEAQQCPNLNHFIARFNKESAWVATELCTTTDLSKRIAALKKFIEITKESLDRSNFFSMFSIMAGLNLTPVQRLKKTWGGLPSSVKKVHEDLEKLCDPSKNMKAYRDLQAQTQPPTLPFLPIYLKDFIFYNDGNPSRVNNLVNFEKMRLLSTHVKETMALAAIPYTFEPSPEVRKYLETPVCESLEQLMARVAAEGFDP